MKYTEALELRKEGSLEKQAWHILPPKALEWLKDFLFKERSMNPLQLFPKYRKMERMGDVFDESMQRMAEANKRIAEANKVMDKAKAMPKWRNRAIGAGILGTAGTVGGFMAGQATAGNPYAQTNPPSYAEWAAANKK